MRTRLVFVRHGDSVHKEQGVIGGPRGCRGLTERGHAQAASLAHRLAAEAAAWGDVAVYASTLPRAIETAAPIAEVLGVPVTTDCDLCTWHVPDHLDGLPVAVMNERFGIAGGGVYRPFQVGNESWAELVTRSSRGIVDIADRHRGATAVIVGHAETVNVSFHALGLLGVYRPLRSHRGRCVADRVADRRRSNAMAAGTMGVGAVQPQDRLIVRTASAPASMG